MDCTPKQIIEYILRMRDLDGEDPALFFTWRDFEEFETSAQAVNARRTSATSSDFIESMVRCHRQPPDLGVAASELAFRQRVLHWYEALQRKRDGGA